MKRRAFVTLGGSILFAGCSSETPSGTTTTETTETEMPQLGVRNEYPFGEWHAMDDWKVTVQSLELTTTFRVDDAEKTVEMPDNQQLAITTVKVENTASSRRGWAIPFGFVVDSETVHESRMSFDHPEFEHEVDIRQLRRVDHQRQFQPEALPVDGGEIEPLWAVAVVPRSVSRQKIQIGLETDPDDVLYPIRWIPA